MIFYFLVNISKCTPITLLWFLLYFKRPLVNLAFVLLYGIWIIRSCMVELCVYHKPLGRKISSQLLTNITDRLKNSNANTILSQIQSICKILHCWCVKIKTFIFMSWFQEDGISFVSANSNSVLLHCGVDKEIFQ